MLLLMLTIAAGIVLGFLVLANLDELLSSDLVLQVTVCLGVLAWLFL